MWVEYPNSWRYSGSNLYLHCKKAWKITWSKNRIWSLNDVTQFSVPKQLWKKRPFFEYHPNLEIISPKKVKKYTLKCPTLNGSAVDFSQLWIPPRHEGRPTGDTVVLSVEPFLDHFWIDLVPFLKKAFDLPGQSLLPPGLISWEHTVQGCSRARHWSLMKR